MLMSGMSTLSFSNGVRTANPRILSRAAATSPPVGNFTIEEDIARPLEVDDLSDAGRARPLEHVVCRRQILRCDAERFVKRDVGRRPASDLGPVRDFADFSQNVLLRDGPGFEGPQVFTPLVDRGLSIVDKDRDFTTAGV